MKKIIINPQDAVCHGCGTAGEVARHYIYSAQPICMACGSLDVRDHRGRAFEPIFGPAKTFRASKYTPPVPDRRVRNVPYPSIRDRRADVRNMTGGHYV